MYLLTFAFAVLLLWVVRFAQDTKYNPSCMGDGCHEKLDTVSMCVHCCQIISECMYNEQGIVQ